MQIIICVLETMQEDSIRKFVKNQTSDQLLTLQHALAYATEETQRLWEMIFLETFTLTK